jgi:hypothetical protein
LLLSAARDDDVWKTGNNNMTSKVEDFMFVGNG